MKLLIFLVSLVTAVGVVAGTLPKESFQVAVAGCCKQLTSQGWQVISRDYNQCQDLNTRFDNRDDIYSRQGKFWWDSSCR